MGYVGLPLSIEFARGGLDVTGVDVAEEKIAQLKDGASYVPDVPSTTVREMLDSGAFHVTTEYTVLAEMDAACICVPTPLGKTRDPDISYIVAAVAEISAYLHKGMVVVLESTTYPGTTDELVLPKLAETGLRVGEDFYLAFSPERVDPGNAVYTVRNTPKVIGGVTEECTRKAAELYQHAVETVVPVRDARTAEMVKLLENTYRAINIGLVNELAIMCDRLDLDVWEIIDAAKTKPFGFMPFYPSPGLGGHCIPVDPLYLSWKLKTVNYTAQFIELASNINSNMPEYVVGKIGDALNEARKSVNGSKILILGVAYKKNVGDTRESPALDIIGLLRHKGAEICYADRFVPSLEVLGHPVPAFDLSQRLSAFDCVVIVTDHSDVDYARVVREAPLVFDGRNATAGLEIPNTCTLYKL